MTEEMLKQRLSKIFDKSNGYAIDADYAVVVTDTLLKVNTSDNCTEEIITEMIDLLDITVDHLVKTQKPKKAASMFMARLSGSKSLTFAHINILLSIIGFTFRQGNKILLYINKYQCDINRICRKKLKTLANLYKIRLRAAEDNAIKQRDIEFVSNNLLQQCNTL